MKRVSRFLCSRGRFFLLVLGMGVLCVLPPGFGVTKEMPESTGPLCFPDVRDGACEPGGSVKAVRAKPELMASSDFPQDVDVEIDLVTNRIGLRGSRGIEMLEGPVDGQAVVKLVLDPRVTEMRTAKIEVLFGEEVSGWSLNMGDSISNNGYSGDGADQSRDGEMQILDGNLAVYGDDHMTADPKSGKMLGSAAGFAVPGATVVFDVADNSLAWRNDRGVDGQVRSPYIFSLSGQEDKEGPVNHDIFIGLNRVVAGGRIGRGVQRVRIRMRP